MNEEVMELAQKIENILNGEKVKVAGKAIILLMGKMVASLADEYEGDKRQAFIDEGIEAVTEDMRKVITILGKAKLQ